MTIASQPSRMTTAYSGNTLCGIDLSSWLSWGSYGLGFAAALHLAPDMANDITTGGFGLTLVAASIAVFFGLVLVIQREMHISLRNTSFGEPRSLVTGGTFAYSRNPMYVAFMLPLAALGYFSPTAAAATIALYVVSMSSLVISVEEATLEANFGSRFKRYCAQTPRWLIW